MENATNTTAGAPAETREQKLEKAFAEGESSVAGVKLRPFSLGTLNFCRQMGLTLFTGPIDGLPQGDVPQNLHLEPGAIKHLPEPVVEWAPDFQLSAFAWLQSAPLKVVMAAVREERWVPLVEEFSFELELGTGANILAEVERIAQLAEAAAVDVAKKPGEGKEKGAPPKS